MQDKERLKKRSTWTSQTDRRTDGLKMQNYLNM